MLLTDVTGWTPGTKKRVLVKCDVCGHESETAYKAYLIKKNRELCYCCSRAKTPVATRNQEKPKCPDCGKQLTSYYHKRCSICSKKGEHNPRYKKDAIRDCIKCGKHLNTSSLSNTGYCKSCYFETHKGEDHPLYKGGYERQKKRNNEYQRDRYKTDINFKLRKTLRNRLSSVISGKKKKGSAIELLGCTVDELIIYLEKMFKEGMTWENYGKWHIDHIIPLVSFDLTNLEELKKACHYTNLQPLWAIDNIKKGGRI